MSLLTIRGLQVAYGGIEALKGISFDVDEKKIVTLIGANGAGKSTFMKILCGILEPSAGNISKEAHERMAYLRQDQFAYEDRRVLDVGCGTGVLAIVAAGLGAQPVVAIDTAEAAREATLVNAAANGVVVDVSTSPLEQVDGQFDVVLANILAPTLVALAPDLLRVVAPGGALVVAGILDGRYDHVLAALTPLRPAHVEVIAGWACIELRA